jgi:hypothetical protein
MLRLTRRCCLAVALSGVVVVSPSASLAALIVPVSQARSVTATASHPSGVPSSDTESAPDFGPFNVTALASSGPIGDLTRASANQTSLIGDDKITLSATLIAVLGLLGGTANASSSFDVTFDLLTTSNYSFFPAASIDSFRSASGRLSKSDGTVLYGFSSSSGGGGTLEAGRYRLELSSSNTGVPASIAASGGQSFQLAFTAIPEPSTAWLVSAGILAMGAAHQRRPTRRARD